MHLSPCQWLPNKGNKALTKNSLTGKDANAMSFLVDHLHVHKLGNSMPYAVLIRFTFS